MESVIRHIGRVTVDRRHDTIIADTTQQRRIWRSLKRNCGGGSNLEIGKQGGCSAVLQVYGEITRVTGCCSCGSMRDCLILYLSRCVIR